MATGPGFMEDNFSTDVGGREDGNDFWMIQEHYIYYAAAADLTGGGAQVVMRVMGNDRKYR